MVDEEIYPADTSDQVIGEYERFEVESGSSDKSESYGSHGSDGGEVEDEDHGSTVGLNDFREC
jgi:hypothetical protein